MTFLLLVFWSRLAGRFQYIIGGLLFWGTLKLWPPPAEPVVLLSTTKTLPGRIYAGQGRQVCLKFCQKRCAGFEPSPRRRGDRSRSARQPLAAGPACAAAYRLAALPPAAAGGQGMKGVL